MKILVFGGTRFIGRAIVEALSARGHELLLVHRGESEPTDLPGAAHLHAERKLLSAATDRLRDFRPEAAIDTRALTRDDAESVISVLPPDIRTLVLSSQDVYRAYSSMHADIETDPVPLTEESELRTERYPYRKMGIAGAANYDKLDVEDCYRRVNATILRLPLVYGERDYQRREEFILRRVRAKRRRIPTGAGCWLWSKGYVRDIANAVCLALESEKAIGETFNVCESKTVSFAKWAEQILAAAQYEAELVPVSVNILPDDLKLTGGKAQQMLSSNEKLRAVLGWKETNQMEALKISVRWHLTNPTDTENLDFSQDDRALGETLKLSEIPD